MQACKASEEHGVNPPRPVQGGGHHRPACALNLLIMLIDAGRRPPSASLYLELCASLPGLHVAALRLLGCALRAGGVAAMQLHARAARLLAGQLRRLEAGSSALVPWTVAKFVAPFLIVVAGAEDPAGRCSGVVLPSANSPTLGCDVDRQGFCDQTL